MIHTTFALWLFFAPAAGPLVPLLPFPLAAPLAASGAQDAITDKRPEVASALEKLDGHVKKKGAEDREAIAVIDQLLLEFKKSGPKDRAAIVKGLSKSFEEKRLEPVDGVPNNQLYLASAVALGHMGPESTKTLMQWIGHKNLKKDVAVQHRLLLSLGRTRDKEGIETLIYNLENKEPTLVSGAAEALGEFEEAPIDVRKKAFEAMLKILMSAKGSKDGDLNDTIARERYDVIAAPLMTSLSKLSKHEERVPEEWQRWWNKNKRDDWSGPQ